MSDLDVLAKEVVAQGFGEYDVLCQSCIRRCCVDAIWPEALQEIQQSPSRAEKHPFCSHW